MGTSFGIQWKTLWAMTIRMARHISAAEMIRCFGGRVWGACSDSSGLLIDSPVVNCTLHGWPMRLVREGRLF